MKSENKDYEMTRFLEAKTKILVSTTSCRVGVDVPNASVIIIESAERFGLSQLPIKRAVLVEEKNNLIVF